MDKNPESVNFSDITQALIKNNLKMSSFIQKQFEAHLNTDKLLKQSKDIQKQTYESINNAKLKEQDSNVTKVDKENEIANKSLTAKTGDGLNANIIRMGKDIKESLKIAKMSPKLVKDSKEKVEGLTGFAENIKTFKGFGLRMQDMKKGFSDTFGLKNIGTTALKALNFGGIFDKRIAQNQFIKEQRALGVHGNTKDSTLRERFNKRNEVAIDIKKNEAEIEKLRKSTGLSEKDLFKTKIGKSLEDKRASLAGKFGKLDKRSDLLNTELEIDPISNFVDKTPTSSDEKEKRVKVKKEEKEAQKTLSGSDEEYQIEQSRLQSEQTDLLVKIEENTRPDAVGQSEPKEAGEGGGILSGIGKGLGALGTGLGKLGAGIGKGIVGIFIGLAKGITILGTAVMSGVGAVGLAALAGIILTIAGALRLAAPAIEAFAPVLMKLAEQIGIVAGVIGEVFIEAIKQLPEVIGSIAGGIVDIISAISEGITSTIDAVTSSIERLASIDGTNLLQVGAGLFAVAGGMAAFAAANVASGISNIATGLMSAVTGQKTPVEQLEQIAAFGPNLNQAGTGVKNLAKGLAEFGNIDAEKIEAISKLPLEKIVAASNASRVTQAVDKTSSDNKMKALPATAQPSTNVVSAPTTITKQTKNIMLKQSIRNPEGSVNQYIRSRYAC